MASREETQNFELGGIGSSGNLRGRNDGNPGWRRLRPKRGARRGKEYTFEEAVEHIGFGRFHKWLLVLCGVGYFAEIMELVVVSFVAPAIQADMGLSSFEYGMLGSSSFLGMSIGAFFWGSVGDSLGRQVSFTLTVWITFLGGFLSAFAPNYYILLMLRILTAFGIGGMLPVDYTVFLEFLPSMNRGRNIVLLDAVGIFPALTISAGISYLFSGDEILQWRWVLALTSIPTGIMAVLRRHVPESPQFHLCRNEVDKAQAVLEGVAEYNRVDLPGTVLSPLQSCEEVYLVDNDDLAKIAYTGDEGATAPATDSSLLEAEGGERTGLQSRKTVMTLDDTGEDILVDQTKLTALVKQREQKMSAGRGRNWITQTFSGSHSIGQFFETKELSSTTWRLWLMYFLTQFSSAGMVFALPMLLEETFDDVTQKHVAADLLWGVVGVVPGLTFAYYAVELSRKLSLSFFYFVGALSIASLGLTTGVYKSEVAAVICSVVLRGAMEGCFAILVTTAVESYPTTIRASGLGTAQIADHIAGALSPVVFARLNSSPSTRPIAFVMYAMSYLIAIAPTLTLPVDYAGKNIYDA